MGSSLQNPNTGRCAQLVVSRQGDFHLHVNLHHLLFPVIKVTFFRRMIEQLEKEDKVNNSSLSTGVADVPLALTVTSAGVGGL